MSMLDDPALGLRAEHRREVRPQGRRVRFQPGSIYARDFAIPTGAIGDVLDSNKRDELKDRTLWIDGVGVATGVPVGEVVEYHPD